jgi:hypothetical protein
MNKVTRRRRHWGVLGAGLAATALLTAACGGGSTPTSAAQTAYQQTLAFSQCMRAHGVPGYPDPQPNGNVLITPQDHLAQGSASFMAAIKACQHLLPKTKPLTAAQQHQVTVQALKFTACMRAHGLTGLADPVVNANGISQRIPNGTKPNSPVFQSAQRACQKLMPSLP